MVNGPSFTSSIDISAPNLPVATVAPALREIRTHWRGLFGAYPEIGDGAPTSHALSPEELAPEARNWIAGGARIVGGCCGTTPDHIRALAAMRDAATPVTRSE